MARPIDLLETLYELGARTPAHVRALAAVIDEQTASCLARIASVLEGIRPPRNTWPAARRARAAARRAPIIALIREKHPLGWSDSAVAELAGVDRRWVCELRRQIGLPSNALSAWHRAKVGAKTRLQCQAAGVKSLAEVRRLAFKKYARENGWPEDLLPRQVQIMNAIYERGPLTKRRLCEVLGMPWKGSGHKTTFYSNQPADGGSYLAGLLRRGLLISLRKYVWGEGPRGGKMPGRTPCDLYLIPLNVKRGGPWDGMAQEENAARADSATA